VLTALGGEINTPHGAAQGRRDHKLVVRTGCRLAFRCGARVIMFCLPEMHL
jgi:hypothetical protein